MTKYTGLELSRKIYEATGWGDTAATHKRLISHDAKKWGNWFLADYNNGAWSGVGELSVPAYDTDYLLDKLPPHISVTLQKRTEYEDGWSWHLSADTPEATIFVEDGGSPTELLGKLCLVLKKEEVL